MYDFITIMGYSNYVHVAKKTSSSSLLFILIHGKNITQIYNILKKVANYRINSNSTCKDECGNK